MKKRFTDEQRIRILREAESGKSVQEIIRIHNISEQKKNWKKLFKKLNLKASQKSGASQSAEILNSISEMLWKMK